MRWPWGATAQRMVAAECKGIMGAQLRGYDEPFSKGYADFDTKAELRTCKKYMVSGTAGELTDCFMKVLSNLSHKCSIPYPTEGEITGPGFPKTSNSVAHWLIDSCLAGKGPNKSTPRPPLLDTGIKRGWLTPKPDCC
jgi:hypothetical protein